MSERQVSNPIAGPITARKSLCLRPRAFQPFGPGDVPGLCERFGLVHPMA